MSYKRERMEDAPPEIVETHNIASHACEYIVIKCKMTPEQAEKFRKVLDAEFKKAAEEE